MITRTYSPAVVQTAIGDYAESIVGLDLEEWLDHSTNVALTNEYRDVGLFERQWFDPTTVAGHYFFISRGKQAIQSAILFLDEIFSGDYNVEKVVGLTPIDHKAAFWMNKRLGFKSHGQIDTETGLHEFVLMTKQEWLQLKDNK
jgi:hypothetical protein